MPQMDGIQAARKIAESGADIPILLFTLNLSPSDHGNGSQRWAAWCDFKGGNQQVAYAIKALQRGETFFYST